ncbi:DUF917 domain-containing protein [Agrococcus sp. HG114]|uniref:DUF917 domain-containing protein n=1 Tax=Agrococcus sp. HG114 TaxID=2969757 RepID=UPI00215AEA49|nr:DUF917 domain-containing protein [Agrococcus sp. HG114]MCR8670519.1 DUF917 domain-containing protein [Agrococcus sp. HG114]
MGWTLERDGLAALGTGASLLGGGGGGTPRLMAMGVEQSVAWPLRVNDVEELDPATPCVAVGIGGSTMVFGERLPGSDLFVDAIESVDRWTGSRAAAVCATEVGGMNALAPLLVARELALVDADLMGRALPYLDQFSLLADDLPGIAIAVSAWTRGSLLLADARPADVEHVLRAAFQAAGGWAGIVIGGFTVGDLEEHAIRGTLARARALGEAWLTQAGIGSRIAAIGAQPLALGRVAQVGPDPADVRVRVIDIAADDGAVVRLVARSEVVACVIDGAVAARSPDIIDVIDPQTGAVLQVEEIAAGRSVAVVGLEAPAWWTSQPDRLAQVLPSRYGLTGLDEVSA